jgi:hypothetical protein
VKPIHRSLAGGIAFLITVVGATVVRADTIFYRESGATDIKKVSGKIVRETKRSVEITTADGRKVSIARDDVFEIVRDTPAAGKRVGNDMLRDFPAAAAVARGETDHVGALPSVVIHYGLKGGLAVSNVRADPRELEDGGSLRGYAIGFWWGLPLSRRLTLQPEITFSLKGDSESADGYTASTRLGYVELPVLARISVFPDAAVQPSLFAGPAPAFNLSARSKLEGEGGEIDSDIKDQVAGFDLSLVAGGGLGFVVGGKTLGIDLRYSRGLLDVGHGLSGSAHNDAVAVLWSIGLR